MGCTKAEMDSRLGSWGGPSQQAASLGPGLSQGAPAIRVTTRATGAIMLHI